MADEEFLQRVKQYIEDQEISNDGEWGMGRSLETLIASDNMPPLYTEVLKRLDSATVHPVVEHRPTAQELT